MEEHKGMVQSKEVSSVRARTKLDGGVQMVGGGTEEDVCEICFTGGTWFRYGSLPLSGRAHHDYRKLLGPNISMSLMRRF